MVVYLSKKDISGGITHGGGAGVARKHEKARVARNMGGTGFSRFI